MAKFGKNVTYMKLAINNVNEIRKSFQKSEMSTHCGYPWQKIWDEIEKFKTETEKPCNKLKNPASKLKTLKLKMENL